MTNFEFSVFDIGFGVAILIILIAITYRYEEIHIKIFRFFLDISLRKRCRYKRTKN